MYACETEREGRWRGLTREYRGLQARCCSKMQLSSSKQALSSPTQLSEASLHLKGQQGWAPPDGVGYDAPHVG